MEKVIFVFHLSTLRNLEEIIKNAQEEEKDFGHTWKFFFDNHLYTNNMAKFIGLITEDKRLVDSGRMKDSDFFYLKEVYRRYGKTGCIVFRMAFSYP